MDSPQAAGAIRGPDHVDSLIALNRALVAQQLLRGLAHDIRNNLQVVALGSSLGEESRGTSIGIRVERSLDDMVNALDLLSRLGKVATGEPPGTDLAEAMSAVKDMANLQRNLPTLRLEVDPPPTPAMVAIPRTELIQILLNLIANAKEAQARPTDLVSVVATMPMDGQLAVMVDDGGTGMPADAGAPFFTTKDPALHGGLGLYVSRLLVERIGGSLGWESRAEGGTRVRLTLPLTDRD